MWVLSQTDTIITSLSTLLKIWAICNCWMKTLILLNCNIAIFVQLWNYLEIAQFFAEADVLVIIVSAWLRTQKLKILEMEKRATFVYSKKYFYVKIISCTKRNWYRNSTAVSTVQCVNSCHSGYWVFKLGMNISYTLD